MQPFRQYVGRLQIRHDVNERNQTCGDVIANEVIADGDVLGEIVVSRIVRQLDGAFVVDTQHDRTGWRTADAGQQCTEPDGFFGR